MLPSPPLTVDSGLSSPRSLKRAFTNAPGDDDTPPLSQPLKRRRCSTSEPTATHQAPPDSLTAFFDPSGLVSPPEYTHNLYDPDFGAKVCQQFRRSRKARHACEAVVSAARIHKYGEEDALAYSPGSTPDHVRSSYEAKQRELDELAEEIIANSDSEADSDSEANDEGMWNSRTKKPLTETSEFQWRISSARSYQTVRSRDEPSADHVKRSRHRRTFSPQPLRSNDTDETTRHNGVAIVSRGRVATRCNVFSRTGFASQQGQGVQQAFMGVRVAAL